MERTDDKSMHSRGPMTLVDAVASTDDALDLLGLTAWAAYCAVQRADLGHRWDEPGRPTIEMWRTLAPRERQRWSLIAESVAETILEDADAWARWLPRSDERDGQH